MAKAEPTNPAANVPSSTFLIPPLQLVQWVPSNNPNRLFPRRRNAGSAKGSATLYGKEERGALVWCRFGPYLSCVSTDDALYDCQPHTRPFVLIGSVKALEDAKKLIGVPHIEPCAVVPDEVDYACSPFLAAYLNTRRLAVPGIFEGIGDQIQPHLPKYGGVTRSIGQVLGQDRRLLRALLSLPPRVSSSARAACSSSCCMSNSI